MSLQCFRELEAFAKFGSDLDKSTQAQLTRGEKLTEILKQPQYEPLIVEKQVMMIVAATSGVLDELPTDSLKRFEQEFFEFVEAQYSGLIALIRKEKALTDEVKSTLNEAISKFTESFKRSL